MRFSIRLEFIIVEVSLHSIIILNFPHLNIILIIIIKFLFINCY